MSDRNASRRMRNWLTRSTALHVSDDLAKIARAAAQAPHPMDPKAAKDRLLARLAADGKLRP